MALLDDVLTWVVVLLVILVVITFLELKHLRKLMHKRKTRASSVTELPDRAHNAILTSKAISRALADSGVMTDSADAVIREAEVAYQNRNYRVVLELADRAKGILQTEKVRHDKMGDLARLERATGGSADETPKELLHKEYPPNYMQAKFTISLAEERIQAARDEGRGIDEAGRLLQAARGHFEAKDYEGALRLAVQSRRSADGEPLSAPAIASAIEAPASHTPTPIPVMGMRCANCGAAIDRGDAFCRKCGTPIP